VIDFIEILVSGEFPLDFFVEYPQDSPLFSIYRTRMYENSTFRLDNGLSDQFTLPPYVALDSAGVL